MKISIASLLLATLVGIGFVAISSPNSSAETSTDTVDAPKGKLVSTKAAPAELATLKVKFVLDGKAPAPKKIDGSRDPICAALNLVSDALIVNDKGEIQNVVMYWDDRKNRKVEIPEAAKKVDADATIVLDNVKCMFTPRVLVAQAGQAITVKNSDTTSHNANFNFLKNQPVNPLVPAGGAAEIKISDSEPAPIPVDCNVHPWMKAIVVIKDHGLCGVSDKNGVLEIKNIPAGEEVVFRVWHEIPAGIDEVKIDGKKEKLRSGRLEITLKPGMNDLGTVQIPADQFKE